MHVYALVSVVPTSCSHALHSKTVLFSSSNLIESLIASPGSRGQAMPVCEAFPVLWGRQMYAHKSPGSHQKPLPSLG